METYKLNIRKDIYPKFFDRVRAKFYKYVMIRLFKVKLTYYEHCIFPFKVDTFDKCTSITLSIPYNYIQPNISITPVGSIDSITMNFTINKIKDNSVVTY